MNQNKYSNYFEGEHTVGSWLCDRAKIDGSKVAVDDRGVTTNYAELAKRAELLAEKFKQSGLRNGDRIVTVTGNSVDHIVTFFACAKVGLVLNPLSWRLTAIELAELITRAEPKLVVYEDEYATLALEAVRYADVEVPANLIGAAGIESEMSELSTATSSEWRAPVDDDPLLLIFTSGSEAKPKGVLLSHSNCFWNNLSLSETSGLGPSDVALCVMPQFHVGGWNIFPLLALRVGATLIIERTFQPKRVIELISNRKVTVMMGVPTQYQMLSKDEAFARADLSSLRIAQSGGAALTAELLKTWQQKGINLSQGYGLTEASPNVLYTPIESKTGGMRPYPHVRVRLQSDKDESVVEAAVKTVVETRGELQVFGRGVFKGYFSDAEATKAAFTEDGWLKTGDIAELDTHGAIHIVGRKKEIYISGGENVAPAEVEEAFVSHAAVTEVVVVGMPDPIWGEVGCAFVVLESNFNDHVSDVENMLIMHVKERLAPFKIPKNVVVLDSIPRIGIDKVDRVKLRALAMALSDGVSTL